MTRRRTNWTVSGYQKELEELDKNKLETGKVTQDSADSTRRMLRLVDECQDAGINTLRMLHHQGETLDRTEGGLEEIHDHLEKGDKTLKKMEFLKKIPLCLLPCYFCCCSKKPENPKTKTKGDRRTSKTQSNLSNSKISRKSEIGVKDVNQNEVGYLSQGRSYSNYKQNQSQSKEGGQRDRYFERITGQKEEDEMEQNLSHVSSHLSSLKSQAQEMGSTVHRQNQQLDRMTVKTLVNQSKVTNLNERSARLVNSDSSNGSNSVSLSPCSCGIC